jgi:hypothetical protein
MALACIRVVVFLFRTESSLKAARAHLVELEVEGLGLIKGLAFTSTFLSLTLISYSLLTSFSLLISRREVGVRASLGGKGYLRV